MSQLPIRNIRKETGTLWNQGVLNSADTAKSQPDNFWTNAYKIRTQLRATSKSFSDSAKLIREDRDN